MRREVGRYVDVVLRLLLGALFLFSGAVKSVDTVGTSLYVEKYLDAFGLGVLDEAAWLVAVLLGAAEISLGVLLIINVLRRYVSFFALLFITVFTVVTLLNLTILPIGDCGCFGDALYLSPWATFLKNLILLPIAFVVWLMGRRVRGTRAAEWCVAIATLGLAIALNLYVLRHLPLIDFMPYAEGTNLGVRVAEERRRIADMSHTELRFRNRLTGEELRFPADDVACWADADLEYVDAVTVVPDDASMLYADFALYDAAGRDVAEEVLGRGGRQVWLCVSDYEVLRANMKSVERLLRDADGELLVLCAANCSAVESLLAKECYRADAMLLRSIIRADVGVVVLNYGVVVRKINIGDV